MGSFKPLLLAVEVKEFLDRNGLSSPADLNPLQTGQFESLDWGNGNRELTQQAMLAHRRLYNLGQDMELSHRLLGRGIHSAAQVAAMPEHHFVEEHAEALSLSPEEAIRLHRRAVGVQNKALHLMAAIHGAVAQPHFQAMRASNIGADIASRFQSLPSYQELFGSLDFCECDECKSIFGPAAYFVDLMRIVDTWITQPNKGSIPANCLLDARRPDLARIPLTCEMTNTQVPYLRVVNERLIEYVRQNASLGDDEESILQKMASDVSYPLNLPFHYPLDRTRVLLQKLGASLSDLFAAWGAKPEEVVREALGLSPQQAQIITNPTTADAALAAFYDVAPGDLAKLTDLSLFMAKTGLTVPEVESLVTQGLSADEIKQKVPAHLFINQGLGDQFLTISADGSTIQNAAKALDSINRLRRLAGALGWSPGVTDWVLRAVRNGADPPMQNNAPLIDQAALEGVLRVKGLAAALNLSPIQAAVFFGPIKTYGDDGNGGPAPFDQLFNDPTAVVRNAPYHPGNNPLNSTYTDAPLSWQPGSPESMDALLRVAPGLGLKLDGLTALGLRLFGGQAATPLTVDALSALYRHALLSHCLSLPVDQYLALLDLLSLNDTQVFTGSDLERVAAAAQWMTAAGLNAFQLGYVLNGNRSVYVDPLLDDSQAPTWLESLAKTVPADDSDDDKTEKIAAQVAIFFGADQPLIRAVLDLATSAVPLPAGVATWPNGFVPPSAADKRSYPDYVTAVLGWVARWLVFAQAADLSGDLLSSVAGHPASYGLPANLNPLTLEHLRDIQYLARLIDQFGDKRGDLLRYVDQSAAAAESDTDPLDALHAATGWDSGQVSDLLRSAVKDVTNVVERLRRLSACFDLIGRLGADVSFMQGLASLAPGTTWEAYSTQARLVRDKVSARYGDRWPAISTQVEGSTEVRKRDALLGITLANLRAQFNDILTPNNVGEFLLIDVQTGPEAQISYIKEALNCVQLYLQRCRLHLEPGVTTLKIPEIWWEWMLNYRVWEANRQVFLYPENYLLPSVRRDKTSLFSQLENDLLQSEVTVENVETAYTAYIDHLCTLADLKPVDAYFGTIKDPDLGEAPALYLFARTKTAPYTFYMCRQVESKPWTEWAKIDLNIASSYISPVYAFNRLFLFWAQVDKMATPSVQIGKEGGQSNTNVSYRASISYSFQDRTGKWVQPQTLTQNSVILFDSQTKGAVPLKEDRMFDGVFEMESLAWQKVLALQVTADNIWPGLTGSQKDAERIVVLYGPFMTNTPTTPDPEVAAATDNPDATAFVAMLRDRARNHSRLLQAGSTGLLPFHTAFVLNSALEASVLTHRTETLLVDSYRFDSPLAQFRARVNDLKGQLQMAPSTYPVADNYLGDIPSDADVPESPNTLSSTAFVSDVIDAKLAAVVYNRLKSTPVKPDSKETVIDDQGQINRAALADLDLGTVLGDLLNKPADPTAPYVQPVQMQAIQQVLFANAGAPVMMGQVGSTARVMTVKNQPGWFLLDHDDETFLLSPRPVHGNTPIFSNFAQGLRISPPPFHRASFIMSDPTTPIDSKTSNLIYQTLQFRKYLDDHGFPNLQHLADTAPEDLKDVWLANFFPETDPTRFFRFYRTLTNAPIVYATAFVSDRITADVSAQIYKYLQNYRLIDTNQRLGDVSSEQVNAFLANLLMDNVIQQKDVTAVYRTLAEAPRLVSLTYWNQGQAGSFPDNGQFGVVRLTTRAVPRLERALFTGGIERLLSLETQHIPVQPVLPFNRLAPTSRIQWPSAIDGAQVDFDGLYGQYFWELFFHGPILVANSLAANQQFREALSWFHYVFDPTVQEQPVTASTLSTETDQVIDTDRSKAAFAQLTSHTIGSPAQPIISPEGRVNPSFRPDTDLSFLGSLPMDDGEIAMVRNLLLNYQLAAPASRFWNFRPFRTHTLEKLEAMLSDDNEAVKAYNNDPFNPFAIARLRIGAFEKATVMQYLDTLLQWGDWYFAQDTWESITAASMLYVYASDLLGPHPQPVGTCRTGQPANLGDIRQRYPDGIPQFLIDLESHLPAPTQEGMGDPVPVQAHGFNELGTYFCIPENTQFTGCWDRVADRLYKIRHSLNLQGQFRTLALFEPPLDPMDLIRAAGGANNVLPATSGAKLAPSPIRFRNALLQARNLVGAASDLGAQVMAALEKKDAEGLNRLRITQEEQLLALTTQVKQKQVDEVQATLESLNLALDSARGRLDYYTQLIKESVSPGEQTHLEMMKVTLGLNIASNVMMTASSVGYAVPQAGSPFAMTYGGKQIGATLQASAGALQAASAITTYTGQNALIMAGYKRRSDEWKLQQTIAQHDIDSITRQIAATDSRLAAVKQDLSVHKQSIVNARQTEEYLRGKFSSQELYQWMVGRLSALYFQTYNLTLEAARKAQSAFQSELNATDNFLDFNYWDNLRKGLLAGSGLRLALDRMEAAYLDRNTRAMEIERTISLADLGPAALDSLKAQGFCEFSLTESLFDYDFPGHYSRKIKSISLSIPAIVGPYENVKATLTQTKNVIAREPDIKAVRYLLNPQDTPPDSLLLDYATGQQVAISRGVDDSGLFVLDFHDERYLPFEGTGALSSWRLEMPKESNHFDFNNLSDVILTLRYTARPNDALKTAVIKELAKYPLQTGYYLDLRQTYPMEWQAFMQDQSKGDVQVLTFPFAPRWAGVLQELLLSQVVVRPVAQGIATWPPVKIGTLTIGSTSPSPLTLDDSGRASVNALNLKRDQYSGQWQVEVDLKALQADPTLRQLLSKDGRLDPQKLVGLQFAIECQASIFKA